MSILKGNIKTLPDEQLTDWTEVKGCIVLADWRPFSRIACLLDYDDIIERNLYKAGCTFLVTPKIYGTEVNGKLYLVKMLKIPKFDELNSTKIACVINDSLGEILTFGGSDYLSIFDDIDKGWE